MVDLCNGLNKKHYLVHILTYQPIAGKLKGSPREQIGNVYIRRLWWPGYNLFHKFESLPPLFNFIYLTPGLLFLSFIFLLKNRKKIDVIHAHGVTALFIAIIMRKIFGIPVVVSTHAIYVFKGRQFFPKIVKVIFNMADKILVLAEGSGKQLIKIGVQKKKIGRYVYWVDQKIFKPLDKKKIISETHLNYDFNVLFAGRLLEIKGPRTILKIAEKLHEKIRFIFIGTGPLEKELREAEKNMSNVSFLGRIDNSKMPIYYNFADILVIPSHYQEGFARVILEALSCGLPVIASNMGVIPEELNKDVGILIEPTPENFMKEISSLYKNRKILEKMSQSAILFARQRYSEKNIEMITAAYDEVLEP